MNLATFIIAGIIAVMFSAVVIISVRNRKKGKCSCAGCSGCKDGCCCER